MAKFWFVLCERLQLRWLYFLIFVVPVSGGHRSMQKDASGQSSSGLELINALFPASILNFTILNPINIPLFHRLLTNDCLSSRILMYVMHSGCWPDFRLGKLSHCWLQQVSQLAGRQHRMGLQIEWDNPSSLTHHHRCDESCECEPPVCRKSRFLKRTSMITLEHTHTHTLIIFAHTRWEAFLQPFSQ